MITDVSRNAIIIGACRSNRRKHRVGTGITWETSVPNRNHGVQGTTSRTRRAWGVILTQYSPLCTIEPYPPRFLRCFTSKSSSFGRLPNVASCKPSAHPSTPVVQAPESARKAEPELKRLRVFGSPREVAEMDRPIGSTYKTCMSLKLRTRGS